MTELWRVFTYLGGFSFYLISGNPIFLRGLCIIALLESFSKIFLDCEQGKFKWRRAGRIVFIKLWFVALIMVATQLDYMAIEAGYEFKKILKVPINSVNVAVFCLVVLDVKRFIANLKGFGVDVPIFFINFLKGMVDYFTKKG